MDENLNENNGSAAPAQKSHGALVGALIIILILIIGGVYIFSGKKTVPENGAVNLEQTTNENEETIYTLEEVEYNEDIWGADAGAGVELEATLE